LIPSFNIKRTTPTDLDLGHLVLLLDSELRASNGDVQDLLDQYNIVREDFKVVVGYLGGEPVACGCFKDFEPGVVEIKRMFVHKDHRRTGFAAAILNALECWAAELGYDHAVLETGTRLTGAVNLYKKAGYKVRSQYGQYIDMENSVCMEKPLVAKEAVAE
jgi:putative acetyltransferase